MLSGVQKRRWETCSPVELLTQELSLGLASALSDLVLPSSSYRSSRPGSADSTDKAAAAQGLSLGPDTLGPEMTVTVAPPGFRSFGVPQGRFLWKAPGAEEPFLPSSI